MFLTSDELQVGHYDKIDKNFSNLILASIDDLIIQKYFENGFSVLKPFVFDTLKRGNRLDTIRLKILEFLSTNSRFHLKFSFFDSLDERDLLCCLIRSVNAKSRSKLGSLISRNDYAVPLIFNHFNINTNEIERKLEFESFEDLLCLTHKPLAIVSGTKNARFVGKSSLIPLLFGFSLNENSSHISISKTALNDSNVDLICNDETCDSWIIADFHGHVETKNAKCALQTLAEFASLHILHITSEDIDDESFSDEIRQLLDWYAKKQQTNDSKMSLVIILRDFKPEKDALKLDALRELFQNDKYSVGSLGLSLSLLTFEDSTKFPAHQKHLKPKNLADSFRSAVPFSEFAKSKTTYSIEDIRLVYDSIQQNNYSIEKRKRHRIECEFDELFNHFLLDTNTFPLSNKRLQIHNATQELKSMNIHYNQSQYEETARQLSTLEQERLDLQPVSAYVSYFVHMLLRPNYLRDLMVFEVCLLDWKKEPIRLLRKSQMNKRNKYSTLVQSLKQLESQLISEKDDITFQQTQAQINQLKKEIAQLVKELKKIDDTIDAFDLTLDKFWDEIFLIYDWICEMLKTGSPMKDEQVALQFQTHVKGTLIDRYIELIEYGYDIHMLRYKPLQCESIMLKMIFEKLKSQQELLVVTVIGEQSSAKSSLMNSLFGSNFKTSAGRCTLGMYINFVTCAESNAKIVILDTEGLMSIDSNTAFDNQLATMAITSAHLIIINHKGEISANIERILGITFYAKLRTSSSTFKPTLMFVLRDQADRRETSVATQASKLKGKLVEQAKHIDKSIDEIMHIEIDDVVLLPNAFSEESANTGMPRGTAVRWRNKLFPECVLELREKIFGKLTQMNCEGQSFDSLEAFYNRMSAWWKTLFDLGDGILNCKDLVEIRIRNEIAMSASSIISKYSQTFSEQCHSIIHNNFNKIEVQENEQSINQEVIVEINNSFQETLASIEVEFKKATSPSHYDQYRNDSMQRIKSSINRIKTLMLTTWNNHSLSINEDFEKKKVFESLISQISQKIVKSDDPAEIEQSINEHFQMLDDYFMKYLTRTTISDVSYETQLKRLYNDVHNDIIHRYTNLEPLIKIVAEFSKFKPQDWLSVKQIQERRGYLFFGSHLDENGVYNWVDKKLQAIRNRIKSEELINSQFVEELHVRKALEIIHDCLFSEDSLLTKYKTNFILSNILTDIVVIVLIYMRDFFKSWNDEYLHVKKHEHEVNKSSIRDRLNNDLIMMRDSKSSGESVAINIMNHIEQTVKKNNLFLATLESSRIIIETLPDPETVVREAFKLSFNSLSPNYEGVYKFSMNISKYIEEVSDKLIENNLKKIITKKYNLLINEAIDKYYHFLSDSTFENAKTIHEFLDICNQHANEDLKSLLNEAKNTIIVDNSIKDTKLFARAFCDTISRQISKEKNYVEDFGYELIQVANSYTKTHVRNMIGCGSTCPGCGSKCKKSIDHEDDHEAIFHLLNGFAGIRWSHNGMVLTEYCWRKSFYEHSFLDGTIFPSFKNYLEQKYPKWASDIRDHNLKYETEKEGDNNMNQSFIDFDFAVKKGWMNVRKAVISTYNKNNEKKVIDRTYSKEWMDLEDENKQLSENYRF